MKTTKFKNSEIGPIPEEWEVKRLGEVFTFKNGYNAAVGCYGSGTPVASVLEALDETPLTHGRIRAKVKAPASARESFPLCHGDLIFTRSSETLEDVGRSNVYLDDIPSMFGGFIIRGRPLTDNNSRFVNYLLKDEHHRERVMAQGAGAQHYNIGQTGLGNVLIAIPPKPEQEKIAAALSDVDELLAAMTTLIAKKRAIKQGAMQELLEVRPTALTQRTQSAQRDAKNFEPCRSVENGEERTYAPRRRLADFTGAWVEKRLGDCGEAIRGVSFKPEQSSLQQSVGKTMLLRSNNIQNDTLNFDDVLFVDNECVGETQLMRLGDILICAANGSRNIVGKSASLKNVERVTFGAFMAVFRPNGAVDAGLIGALLQTASYHRQLDDILTGSAINNLNAKDIESLTFAIPSTLAEQKAIAGVLADMDAEIAALEAKRAKYEQIKQGMMQELLTGKTRLA